MDKKKITHSELEERVAVLRRFKSLLQDQRDKFSEYLCVLEKQEESIAKNNIEAVMQHTELENNIIQNILSMQKVIEPIEKIYYLSNPEDENVLQLKNDLERLQESVQKQNEKNRLILCEKMASIKQDISNLPLRNKYATNVYSKHEDIANYIDVSS
ncbi:MAG: flagellar biosynthesis protein FlgN [Treponema sp.]